MWMKDGKKSQFNLSLANFIFVVAFDPILMLSAIQKDWEWERDGVIGRERAGKGGRERKIVCVCLCLRERELKLVIQLWTIVVKKAIRHKMVLNGVVLEKKNQIKSLNVFNPLF